MDEQAERPRRIVGRSTAPVARLGAPERRAMFELFSGIYEVREEVFQRDLDGKDYVIRLFDEGGRLAGFSTLQLIDCAPQGRPARVLFSGDTVIDPRSWGQKELQRAFVAFVTREKLSAPRRPLYWFLITKGYKTYLLTRKNFRCYPNREGPTPPGLAALLDEVARRKYPGDYIPELGIIRFAECQGKVREEFEDIGEAERGDPEIAFFLARNPGFRAGDELCTLAEVRLRDLVFIVFKYFFLRPLQSMVRR